jgi:Fe-S oxidoreductase
MRKTVHGGHRNDVTGLFDKEELKILKSLNFNFCLQCGKCTASCPVFLRTELNPRTLVRKTLYFVSQLKICPPLSISEISSVWACTTCSNCVIYCPRDVKPMDIILAFRTILIERGNVPSTISEALENIYKFGNPFGISSLKRAEWAQDLSVKKASEESEVDLLYFVGCLTSYDNRAQNIARSMVIILKNIGVNFSILAEDENCCGNEVYSLGERGLFEVVAEKNVKRFRQYKISKIITTCSHCFNTLKNRYKLENIEVQHSTQFLSDLIDKAEINFSKRIAKKIAFHDPCYLGKHNNIFEEPRKILENIPGVTLLELERSRKNSLCCGGGGGRTWYEVTGEISRPSEDRIKEAIDMGAEILAVACPFCLLELEDAVKRMGYENKLQVLDIVEVICRSLGGL